MSLDCDITGMVVPSHSFSIKNKSCVFVSTCEKSVEFLALERTFNTFFSQVRQIHLVAKRNNVVSENLKTSSFMPVFCQDKLLPDALQFEERVRTNHTNSVYQSVCARVHVLTGCTCIGLPRYCVCQRHECATSQIIPLFPPLKSLLVLVQATQCKHGPYGALDSR